MAGRWPLATSKSKSNFPKFRLWFACHRFAGPCFCFLVHKLSIQLLGFEIIFKKNSMKLLFIVPTFFIFGACNNADQNTRTNNASNSDKTFQQLSDEFLQGYLNWRPQAAVALGFHEYDGKIADLGRGS